MRLSVGDVDVASYAVEPDVDPRHGPRPHLHPVRTLGGRTVTDAQADDHPWHLGVSVALQDVNGFNLWGGRTYVRGQGYTWQDDHGRIAHTGWLPADEGFAETLAWLDPSGGTLLTEERAVLARAAARGWELTFAYTLTAPAAHDVTLGSPATNGRPDGAGYGGFFWRAAPGVSSTFTAKFDGEHAVNGSGEPWVALTGPGPYTLVFTGLQDDDRWFVRTGIYPGVCAALAFDRPLVVPAGTSLERRIAVLVADGALTRDEVREACAP
jgi:hypothetical protein